MELLHEPRPTSSEFDAARLASLSALQAMSAWGTSTGLPRAVDILTDMPASQRDPRASDSGHKALSVVMVEAEFESGSLRDIIVALFQRPDTPPALAEVACAMLVNFWRDAASLQVLLRAVNAGSTACAALASFRRHRRSEPQYISIYTYLYISIYLSIYLSLYIYAKRESLERYIERERCKM